MKKKKPRQCVVIGAKIIRCFYFLLYINCINSKVRCMVKKITDFSHIIKDI